MPTAKGLPGAPPQCGTWAQPEDRWSLLDPGVLGWLLEHEFSPALPIEFGGLRLAGEPTAAALAALAGGVAEKAMVQQATERMQAAERGEDDPLVSDTAFHIAVLRASMNRFHGQLTGLIATALRFSIRTTNRDKAVRLASVAAKAAVAEEAVRTLVAGALDLVPTRKEHVAPHRPASTGR